MKTRLIKGLTIVCFSLLNIYVLKGQTPVSDSNWTIYFEDYFTNPDSFNAKGWCSGAFCENSHVHCGDGTPTDTPKCELQYYDSNNIVYKAGGGLSLQSKINPGSRLANKKRDTNDILCDSLQNLRWFTYTSGSISKYTWSDTFQYGYFELRCKVPKGYGYWPAFWLWGSNGSIDQEIDILEMNGDKSDTCDKYETNTDQICIVNAGVDLSLDYHTYALAWTPHSVIFYRDDKQTSFFQGESVPYLPMYLIINLAIDPWYKYCDSINFPENSMDIEYVKVYSLKRNCNDSVVCSNFNFVGYDYSLVKLYRISNSIVPLNIPVTLRATDEIELQAGFEVPLGAEFCAMITECY